MDDALTRLQDFFACQPSVQVAWLYGSRAREDWAADSDFDIALALQPNFIGNYEHLDELRYQLQQQFTESVSLVDINRAPVPLALNIINEGSLLLCRNSLRLRREQQRCWSMWEEYKYEHEKNRH